MSISIINNIFSEEEINHINEKIEKCDFKINNILGRTEIDLTGMLNKSIVDKFKNIINDISDTPLALSGIMSVEYSNMHGNPTLPPHFDGDSNDLIINMQLSSNTVWDIGLNLQTYRLEDNSAIVFNANKEIHWRTHKKFNDGEYVRMLFVRFYNPKNVSDYSHLRLSLDDPALKDFLYFRDSYPQVNI
jgi:hypothetical protein